ncbi:AraC family transcriptional regulator [Paenibacillus koleovorans]|uniref:AraC family transcriptional regulator n=1 Tax=Paenibacillus koleovorans TaxID=121608 RepID=UPI000FD9050E|nr:AraC family transcriptional regulator [Paenibacillus koleovorans]
MNYPVYQDAVAYAMQQKGKLPCYVLRNTLTKPSELHHHDFVELSFVIEGNGTETINGIQHRMSPGTVSFLLPHHIHRIVSDDPLCPIRLYSCMFDIRLLFETQNDAELGRLLLQTGRQLPSHYDLRGEQLVKMRRLMEELAAEFEGDAFGRPILMRHKLIEALLLLMRWRHAEKPFRLQDGVLSSIPISNILQYLHLNYAEPISLKSLADTFNWSTSYISRSFKEYTGTSFLDYLHQLRIQSASTLLITTQMQITDISVEVGFEHFRTFSRIFKELKGITPRGYRMAHAQRLE